MRIASKSDVNEPRLSKLGLIVWFSQSVLSASLTARGAPPPLALARRLRAPLGPQALLPARGAPPPLALARRLRASLGPQALLPARGAPPPLALARRLRASLGPPLRF